MNRATTALAITAAVLLPAACGRAYPHPWCAPVIHALTTKTTAHREIAQLQAQAGKSPLARQLASDMQNAQAAIAAQASSSNLDAIGTTAAAISAMNRIGTDADRVAAACGTKISHRDIYVPAG